MVAVVAIGDFAKTILELTSLEVHSLLIILLL